MPQVSPKTDRILGCRWIRKYNVNPRFINTSWFMLIHRGGQFNSEEGIIGYSATFVLQWSTVQGLWTITKYKYNLHIYIYRGRFLSSMLLLVKARLYNVPKGYYIETSPNYNCTWTELIHTGTHQPGYAHHEQWTKAPLYLNGTFPSKAHFIPLEACAPLTKLLAKFFQLCRISCQCCCLRSREALLD